MANRWTAAEISILKEAYINCGTAIPELLSRHTVDSVADKARQLGLKAECKEANRSRTCLFDGKVYATITKACAAADVDISGYFHYCRDNGIDTSSGLDEYVARRVPAWSEDEVAIMLRYYASEGGKVASRLPGRTIDAIRVEAKKLGLRYQGVSVPWTEDDKVLISRYPYVGIAVRELLPTRSESAICKRVVSLGLTKIVDSRPRALTGFVLTACPVCGTKVLLPYATWLRDFVHGPLCEQYLWEEA